MEKRSLFVQEIYTECKIDASSEKVYSLLSEFSNYASWTSEIIVSGDTRPGGKMRVNVKTANNGAGWFTLASKMQLNDSRMIAFDNVLFAPFLFLGKHRFEIIPLSDNQTMVINAEIFSGLAVPFVRKNNLMTTTRRYKENVNRALKSAAEASIS